MELHPAVILNENGEYINGTIVKAILFEEISPRTAIKLAQQTNLPFAMEKCPVTIISPKTIQEVCRLLSKATIRKYVFLEPAYLYNVEDVTVSEKFL